MDSICNFIPVKNNGGDLKTVHFVYETEFKKMKQPFLYPVYYMHLVTKGEGILKLHTCEFRISEGTLFFAFPGVPYEIEGSDDLTYIYISFMGLRAKNMLEDMKITASRPTYDGFDELIPFWKRSIQRVDRKNANILTESVLLYTLSYISDGEDGLKPQSRDLLESIIGYIDNNYGDPDISLKKIADIFAYTDKYLSHLFKDSMQMNFSQYLTRLRMHRAIELIGEGERNIDSISTACGYRDTVYFAKVFKKYMKVTPYVYIKQKQKK